MKRRRKIAGWNRKAKTTPTTATGGKKTSRASRLWTALRRGVKATARKKAKRPGRSRLGISRPGKQRKARKTRRRWWQLWRRRAPVYPAVTPIQQAMVNRRTTQQRRTRRKAHVAPQAPPAVASRVSRIRPTPTTQPAPPIRRSNPVTITKADPANRTTLSNTCQTAATAARVSASAADEKAASLRVEASAMDDKDGMEEAQEAVLAEAAQWEATAEQLRAEAAQWDQYASDNVNNAGAAAS